MYQSTNPIVDALLDLKQDLKRQLVILTWAMPLCVVALLLLDFFLTKYYGNKVAGTVLILVSALAFLRSFWIGKSRKNKN